MVSADLPMSINRNQYADDQQQMTGDRDRLLLSIRNILCSSKNHERSHNSFLILMYTVMKKDLIKEENPCSRECISKYLLIELGRENHITTLHD